MLPMKGNSYEVGKESHDNVKDRNNGQVDNKNVNGEVDNEE